MSWSYAFLGGGNVRVTIENIDLALKAYAEIRFNDFLLEKSNKHHIVNHIKSIENILKKFHTTITEEKIVACMEAYSNHRSPYRWDGEPVGEAGRENHREGIKSIIRLI